MSNKNDDGYEVGYGRPPKHTRFAKGRSGNPKGRPRGSNNFETDVRNTLNMPVPVTENGRRRKISTQKANLLLFREKALKGDAKAMAELLNLAKMFNSEDLLEDIGAPLSVEDQAILDAFLKKNKVKLDPSN